MATYSVSVTIDVSNLADANNRIAAYCVLFDHDVRDAAIETLLRGTFTDYYSTVVRFRSPTRVFIFHDRILAQELDGTLYSIYMSEPTTELTIRYNP